jgi:hypothetical protein
VRPDALVEALRLADVEDLAAAVAEDVDAGLRRERGQLFGEGVRRFGRGGIREWVRSVGWSSGRGPGRVARSHRQKYITRYHAIDRSGRLR